MEMMSYLPFLMIGWNWKAYKWKSLIHIYTPIYVLTKRNRRLH